MIDRTDRSQTLCQEFNISYVTDLSAYPFVRDKVQLIPYAMAKNRTVLPVDEHEDVLIVALEDPLDLGKSRSHPVSYREKNTRDLRTP